MAASQPAISFEQVSKRFEFSSEKSQSVLESIISLFSRRRRRSQVKTLWALHGVSFDVMPGECLGIIGSNGSGKSTVLKLTTGIIRPSQGRVTVRGRLSALLELGAGFHPDLTGTENIYLNASILGMSKEDIAGYFDQIVEFSELGEFIHMPVKFYSSGMYMRLGFSVAVHVKPDVLLVDEILAVGDQSFQEKCVNRIYDMRSKGTTIVFVSHNLETVRTLCRRVLWLQDGQIKDAGRSEEVINRYLEQSYLVRGGYADSDAVASESFRRWGNREIEITNVRILDTDGRVQETFKTGDAMTIEIAYVAHKPVTDPEFGLAIYRRDGVQVNGPNNRSSGHRIGEVHGTGLVRYNIERLPLLPARYTLSVAVHDSRLSFAYDYHDQAYSFRIGSGGTHETQGLVEVASNWESVPVEVLPISHPEELIPES